MSDIDLTGWSVPNGSDVPDTLEPDDSVLVLLRGTPEGGPKESGPAKVANLQWQHAIGDLSAPLDPMTVITRGVLQPAGDIIGFRPEGEEGGARYPHIRAGMPRVTADD